MWQNKERIWIIYVPFFPLQIPIYFEFLALTRYEFNLYRAAGETLSKSRPILLSIDILKKYAEIPKQKPPLGLCFLMLRLFFRELSVCAKLTGK